MIQGPSLKIYSCYFLVFASFCYGCFTEIRAQKLPQIMLWCTQSIAGPPLNLWMNRKLCAGKPVQPSNRRVFASACESHGTCYSLWYCMTVQLYNPHYWETEVLVILGIKDIWSNTKQTWTQYKLSQQSMTASFLLMSILSAVTASDT